MLRVKTGSRQGLHTHFWVGLTLMALGHFLIFARTPDGSYLRPLSDYWFAAVWFGYIFAVDALVFQRDGRSLFVSRRPVFLAMLPLSACVWWGFEWVNERVQNWHYLRPYDIPDWYANLVSCVFFATVIPAIWETADWIRGTQWVRSLPKPRPTTYPRLLPYTLIAAGIVAFVLPLFWPQYFFALIWGSAAMVLDPINYLAGRPSMIGYIEKGQWRFPLAFYAAGLTCGVLWEFWNFWAFPKWFYTVPYVGFLKVFEMPLLGYLGYGPFAWELFSIFWFFAGLVPRNRFLAALAPPEGTRDDS